MNELRKSQSGYNLVEVLIAMALLGTVMISIMTLFVMGRSNVYSGKQMTQAVAVGTMVSEDLSTMTRGDVVAFFGLGTATLGNVQVAGVTYPGSVGITTKPQTAAPAQGTAYLNKWKALLTAQQFANAKLTLIVTPIRPAGGPTMNNAPILRVRTVIEWSESQRPRNVALDTVKTDRTKT
jgi:prepilin-type N-terminal cleavage/methylation domain-containing protein